MAFARIEGNRAVEVVSFDPATHFHPAIAARFQPIADGVQSGAELVDGEWVNPPPPPPPGTVPPVEPGAEPVPQVVSRFQARAAMMLAPSVSGEFPNLLAEINAAVEASGDAMAQLAWAEAVEWRRDSPVVNAMGGAVGVTQEQLDDLFRQAAQIVA